MAAAKSIRRTPAIMISLLIVLTLGTGFLVWLIVDGFYFSGWIVPYWDSLSEAQGAIIAQLIFFLAAAWASLLVPILFGERLKSLEAAAAAAQETYSEIKQQLADSVEESKRQFKSISRYQQMALGYFANDGLLSQLETAEEKKDFIDNAWDHVTPKLNNAILRLHGSMQNSIGAYRSRSPQWWDKIKLSRSLGVYFEAFKTISDAKAAVVRGADASFDTVKKVNDALKLIRDFDLTESANVNVGAEPAPKIGDSTAVETSPIVQPDQRPPLAHN